MLRLSEQFERSFACLGDLNGMVLGFKVETQPVGQVPLIFNNQNVAHECCREFEGRATEAGSSRVNVLPWPGPSLSANARPP